MQAADAGVEAADAGVERLDAGVELADAGVPVDAGTRNPNRAPQLAFLAGELGGPGNLDGFGRGARFSRTVVLASDADATYVGDTNALRRVDLKTGQVSTLAGGVYDPGCDDGEAPVARFRFIGAIALDAHGTLFVADDCGIRGFNLASRHTTTVFARASTPSWYWVGGLVPDNRGHLYFSDVIFHTIHRLMLDGAQQGTAELLAGEPQMDVVDARDGVGRDARFVAPQGFALDAAGETLFLGDGRAIRKMNLTTKEVSTVRQLSQFWRVGQVVPGPGENEFLVHGTPGTGPGQVLHVQEGSAGELIAQGQGITAVSDSKGGQLVVSSGEELWRAGFAWGFGEGVYQFPQYLAGSSGGATGLRGSSIIDGAGPQASFGRFVSMCTSGDDVLVGDSLSALRRVTWWGEVTTVTRIAGTSPYVVFAAAMSCTPTLAYFGVTGARSIDRYDLSSKERLPSIPLDDSQRFYQQGLTGDDEELYFVDHDFYYTSRQVRRFNLRTHTFSVVGDGSGVTQLALDRSHGRLFALSEAAHVIEQFDLVTGQRSVLAGVRGQSGWKDGAGREALFSGPADLVSDGRGSLYVADSNNATIRKVDESTGEVTTVAGVPGMKGIKLGPLPAGLNWPYRLTLVHGDLIIGDAVEHTLLKLVLAE